jgi:2-oxoacid:acceptor oxidoreductase gamma subunit (pyruvate/2-ketoisovalerate family)
LYQIRWHGRGGQGAVTAARIFGLAASVYGDSFAQSFPSFGAERRGAPVLSFTKVDSVPILDRSQIYEPNMVVILDKSLIKLTNVTEGLKPGGKIVVNASEMPAEFKTKAITDNFEVILVNATRIALEILHKPIVNTAMVGAACRASGLVTLESLAKAITELFPGNQEEINQLTARRAYEEAHIYRQGGDLH